MPLSKIVANSITDNTITTDQIADTSVHGRRNIVQNGSYTVNQRGNISSSATTISANTYIIDRWYLRKQNTGSHSVTVLENQTVTGLTGLHNVLKITEFHDSAWLGNFIEIATHPFLSGQQVTVSYYAKADSAISTFKVFLHDNNDGGSHGNPYFTQTGTISTSWQRYSHTMTVGTLANDNAAGYLNLGFGQTDTDTAFYITGVQFEIGSKATPLENRSFDEELTLCQRYAWKLGGFGSDQYFGAPWLYFDGNNIHNGPFFNPMQMRAAPSLTQYGNPILKNNGGAQSDFSFSMQGGGKAQCFSIQGAKTSHGLSNVPTVCLNSPTTSDFFLIDAEL